MLKVDLFSDHLLLIHCLSDWVDFLKSEALFFVIILDDPNGNHDQSARHQCYINIPFISHEYAI